MTDLDSVPGDDGDRPSRSAAAPAGTGGRRDADDCHEASPPGEGGRVATATRAAAAPPTDPVSG